MYVEHTSAELAIVYLCPQAKCGFMMLYERAVFYFRLHQLLCLFLLCQSQFICIMENNRMSDSLAEGTKRSFKWIAMPF